MNYNNVRHVWVIESKSMEWALFGGECFKTRIRARKRVKFLNETYKAKFRIWKYEAVLWR